MLKLFSLFLMIAMLCSCKNDKAIVLIEKKITKNSRNELIIHEAFTVNTPPKDKNKLKAIFQDHNKKSIFPKESYFCIIRSFYKETAFENRNFKPYYDITGEKIYFDDVAFKNKIAINYICKKENKSIENEIVFFKNGLVLESE